MRVNSTSQPRSTEGLLPRLAPIRGTLIFATVVATYDLGFVGAYLLSGLCTIWFVVAVIRAVLRRPTWRVAAARILTPVVVGLLAFGNHHFQGTIAMGNAAHVIQACERYREATGSYPKRLDELVPRYLNKVPRAKYCLLYGEFWYWGPRVFADRTADQTENQTPRAILTWYELPPYGRRIYAFETGKWGYID